MELEALTVGGLPSQIQCPTAQCSANALPVNVIVGWWFAGGSGPGATVSRQEVSPVALSLNDYWKVRYG